MVKTELLGNTIALVIVIALVILELVSNWKVFVKMGEPGWKCLIPFYNIYVECKHFWSTAGFLALLILSIITGILSCLTVTTVVLILSLVVAIAAFVLRIMFFHYKSRAFGKGVGMTLLLIFFPFIADLVLGFGAAEYVGNQAGE